MDKLKKITVITTGGTIGSAFNADSVSVEASGQTLVHEIEHVKQALAIDVDVISPINKNSEAFSPSDWLDVLHALQHACNTDSQGIVVTHGTDTMVYTLSAVLAFSHLWNKTICFTGAYYAPEHPDSDAPLSLQASLSFAAENRSDNGVYLAFRANSDNNQAILFDGVDVKPMGFDEQVFSAVYNTSLADYSRSQGWQHKPTIERRITPQVDSAYLPEKQQLQAAQKKVALITLYPGIDITSLQAMTEGRDVVVLTLYHCGTGPFGSEYSDLIDHIETRSSDTLFLMGSLPANYIKKPYQSTRAIMAAGGVIYRDIQAHFLYVFALLSLASNGDKERIKSILAPWQVK